MLGRTSVTQLGILRAVVFGVWLIIVLRTPIGLYADLPAWLFAPVGVPFFGLVRSDLLSGVLMQTPVLAVFKAMLIVCCALAASGTGPYRVIAVLAFLLVAVFDWLVKGYLGYINHAQIVLLYASVILAFSPAADAFRIPARRRRTPIRRAPGAYTAPMLVISLAFCLVYSFVGTRRLVHGGLEIFTGTAANSYLGVQGSAYSEFGIGWGVSILDHPELLIMFKLGFLIVTLFEVFAPVCLVSSRFRWAWVTVMLPFHFATFALMSILFWENLLLMVALFTPWPSRLAIWTGDHLKTRSQSGIPSRANEARHHHSAHAGLPASEM